MSKVTIYTDGASRGNPGDAGIGVVIESEDGIVLREISEYIGKTTNNVAEYTALIRGLQAAADLGATEVDVCTDSELMAHQVNGLYKVKAPGLQPLYAEAVSLLRCFRRFRVGHVYRESNSRADLLASQAAKKMIGKRASRAAKPKPRPKPPAQVEFDI
jgi:ribonuclease HI